MTTTEKRRKFIIDVLYLGILIAVFYFAVNKFFSILMPFIVALLMAMLIRRPVDWLTKKTKLKRGPWSVIAVIVVFLIFGGILVLIGLKAAGEVKSFVSFLYGKLQNFPEMVLGIKDRTMALLAKLPQSIGDSVGPSISQFFDNVAENGLAGIKTTGSSSFNWTSLLSTGGDILISTVGQVPTLLIGFVITIVSSIFISSDYYHIRDFIMCQMKPENGRKLVRAKQISIQTLGKMIRAYGLIFVITTIELTIAFSVLKIIGVYTSDYLFLIAMLTAVIDIIPVLGTGTVLIPWGVISLLTGHIGLGIGLLISYGVILIIRQVLEPKLVSGQVGLPPIATIAAMYIGTKTLGVLGFFILPLLVVIINELNKEEVIRFFRYPQSDAAQETPAPAEK